MRIDRQACDWLSATNGGHETERVQRKESVLIGLSIRKNEGGEGGEGGRSAITCVWSNDFVKWKADARVYNL